VASYALSSDTAEARLTVRSHLNTSMYIYWWLMSRHSTGQRLLNHSCDLDATKFHGYMASYKIGQTTGFCAYLVLNNPHQCLVNIHYPTQIFPAFHQRPLSDSARKHLAKSTASKKKSVNIALQHALGLQDDHITFKVIKVSQS